MCWHKWIPVTPQGCKALNPHIMMHKETIYCNTVIDTAIKLSQPNYFLDEDERERRRDNTRFRLQACPHEDSKIVDSFNRRIEVKPLQVVNPRCPCCTGEMSMVDALMTDSSFQSSYAVLPNGRELHISSVTEELDDHLCDPLNQSLLELKISKKKIHQAENGIFDTDSVEDEHSSETYLQCRYPLRYPSTYPLPYLPPPPLFSRDLLDTEVSIPMFRGMIEAQSCLPKIWQMTPQGIVSGMITPAIEGVDDSEDEYEVADLGCVGLGFAVTRTASPPFVNPLHGLIQRTDDEWLDNYQGA
ncbi:unnamed protein product [Penicillium manginii]